MEAGSEATAKEVCLCCLDCCLSVLALIFYPKDPPENEESPLSLAFRKDTLEPSLKVLVEAYAEYAPRPKESERKEDVGGTAFAI